MTEKLVIDGIFVVPIDNGSNIRNNKTVNGSSLVGCRDGHQKWIS